MDDRKKNTISLEKVLSETSRRQKAQRAINNIGSRVKTYAILTSENPMGNRFSKSDNAQLINRLKSYLKNGNFVWFPIKGMCGEKENSFIVYNISLTDTLDIANKFNQESIIWCDNESGEKQYWEQNGDGKFSKTHVRNYIDDMTNAEDYYTQVNRNFKFQIPFFNGKDDEMLNEMISEHNAIIDRVVRRNLKRINGDDNYYNRKVNDMLSSTKTGGSKWEARGSLYAGFSPYNLYAYPLLKEVYDSCSNNTKPISINETNAKRLLDRHTRFGYAIISASRGGGDFGLDSSIPNEDRKLREINNKRTKELVDDVRKAGFSYTLTYGGFIENKGEEDEREVYERSVVVYANKTDKTTDMDRLMDFAIEMCRKYNQDSVLIQEPNKPAVYLDKNGNVDFELGSNMSFNDASETYFTDLHKNTGGKMRKSSKPTRFSFTESYIGARPQCYSESHIRYLKGEVFLKS